MGRKDAEEGCEGRVWEPSEREGRKTERSKSTPTPKSGDRAEGAEPAGRADIGNVSQGKMEGTYGPAGGAEPLETQRRMPLLRAQASLTGSGSASVCHENVWRLRE